MWILPWLSGVLGTASLTLFVWAIWLLEPPRQSRLATALDGVGTPDDSGPPGEEPWETVDRAASITRMIARLPWVDKLQIQLLRAGWMLKPSEFIAFSALGALALSSLLMLATHSNWMAIPGFAVACTLVWIVLRSRQISRNRALSAQLPDTLDMICSALRAGFSFGQAMNRVRGQTTPPLSDEFRHALEEIRLGRSLSAALETMVVRTANYDLALVVSAIQTQLEIGGNVAEVLSNIASMIRERVKLKGEIAVASAEGRLSAIVLLAMPVGMGLLIRVLHPTYLNPLFGTPEGKLLLIIGGALMLVGGLILNRLTAIDV